MIAALYEALATVAPSPVVELNRAVAVSMAFGPEAGLEIVDALSADRTLETYHLLPSVRGDLLEKLGRWDEARQSMSRPRRSLKTPGKRSCSSDMPPSAGRFDRRIWREFGKPTL